MIKRLALAIACLNVACAPQIASATATRLTSYASLMDALKSGHRVMAIGDAAKCKVVEYDNKGFPKDDMTDPDLESVMGINFSGSFFLRYRDYGDKRYHVLAIANTPGSTADGTLLHRFKQIKIYDDNTARMSASAYDFQTGKFMGRIVTSCNISNGKDQNGLSIFDYDAVS